MEAAIIIGTALTVASMGAQAKAAKETAEYNAQQALEDAAVVREQAREEEEKFREEGEKLKGTQRTVIGGSAAKMGEGTPLAIMKETSARIEQDALKIRKEGERIAEGYEEEAGHYQRVASQIVPASLLGMGSTLFSRLSGLKFKKKNIYRGASTVPRIASTTYSFLGY